MDRNLTVSELRRIERSSWMQPVVAVQRVAPVAGPKRRRWLKERLARYLREDVEVCQAADGMTIAEMLQHFETVTGQRFAFQPGVEERWRMQGLGSALRAVQRGGLVPDLLFDEAQGTWSRCTRANGNQVEAPVPLRREEPRTWDRSRVVVERRVVLEGMAFWLRGHRHLRPVEPQDGETAMALLILWEVDHGQRWPCCLLDDDMRGRTRSFSLAMRTAVRRDQELGTWLFSVRSQKQLAPGMPQMCAYRYAVRINTDTVGAVWHERWRGYLEDVLNQRTQRRRAMVRPTPSSTRDSSGELEVANLAAVGYGRIEEVASSSMAASVSEEQLVGVRRSSRAVSSLRKRNRDELLHQGVETGLRQTRATLKRRRVSRGGTEPTQSPSVRCRRTTVVGSGKRGRVGLEEGAEEDVEEPRQKKAKARRCVSRHGRTTEAVT